MATAAAKLLWDPRGTCNPSPLAASMACLSWPRWHKQQPQNRIRAGKLWRDLETLQDGCGGRGLEAGESCLALPKLPNSDYKETMGSQKMLAMGLEISCYSWPICVSSVRPGTSDKALCPCVSPLTHTKHNLWDKMPATSQYLSRLLVEIRSRFWKSGMFQAKWPGRGGNAWLEMLTSGNRSWKRFLLGHLSRNWRD